MRRPLWRHGEDGYNVGKAASKQRVEQVNRTAIFSIFIVVVASHPATAAPALYHCEFNALWEKGAGPKIQKTNIVEEYVYDPAAASGLVIGSDRDVLVVQGPRAISFVTKGSDGSVDSTTISKKGVVDNKLPAVFSSHHIGEGLEPKQSYGFCTLSQRG